MSIGACLKYLTTSKTSQHIGGIQSKTISKVLSFILLMFQSSNVQFLYTQHWSFLGSILTPEEGKAWFAPIAGLGSITSTLAASNVSTMVEKLGLIGLLCTGGLIIGSSALFANAAYAVAKEVRMKACCSWKKYINLAFHHVLNALNIIFIFTTEWI